ncbi:hypothetical protein [Gillisia marina]|uniref:hypothetical protein n=1 Tax=Gillisia marina TaxID=1167637 RepID=UPI00029ABAFA|nr:hypothetical protein [Gillisia marina]
MKKYILVISCFLLSIVDINGQVTDKMNFQMLVRDASGELRIDSPIGIKIQLLQGSNTGPVIFEETHNTITGALGVTSVKIGGGLVTVGDLNSIDWSSFSYYIGIGIDPLGDGNFTLQTTSKLNSVPIAASSLNASMALTADYNSLTNKPVTMTSEQISILGFLALANAIDLDATNNAVDLNSSKSFPGFGNTTGTAFENLWSKIGNNLFFEGGNVGIGTIPNLESSAAKLNVEGGVLYEKNTSIIPEIGTLHYTDFGFNSPNDFYFHNNLSTQTFFRSDPDKDIVFLSDVNIISKLGIGESITPSYDFGINTFVIASSTPRIGFHDTSTSASFPTADWSIEINDDTDLGESFFSLSNFNTGDSNFKIMAGAPSNAFNILENGNVGMNLETPSTKLELPGTVKAITFVGDISGLTNLSISGTSSTTNTGSTTIGADNNSDNVGAVIFKTQSQNLMSIEANGNIAVGDISPSANLEVDGNLKADDITSKNFLLNAYLVKPINMEMIPDFVNYTNIGGKSIITMNPTTNKFIVVLNGIDGQVVTFINSGSGAITFFSGSLLTPGTTNIILEQNESMTVVKSGNNYLPVSLVN